ncbi:hypothetical protein N7470_010108 [Penicillium chermesinum]|nr:hypothetical protein N7470_010108 [Penicillium chermesinum]
MSDLEQSVVAATSSSPSLPATDSTALNYAFLVHSQKTLTQNLPPRVDNKLLARQKRRRTSPEDHAILEEEYQRNPKPDKVARANIVNRVSLGEKEVQVRAAKTLTPKSLFSPSTGALILADLVSKSSPERPSQIQTSPAARASRSSIETTGEHQAKIVGRRAATFAGFGSSDGEKEDDDLPPQSTQTSVATEAVEETPPTTQEEFHGHSSGLNLENGSDENQLHVPKRKRSLSDVRGEGSDEVPETVHVGITTPVKSPPSLRLSFSFDGEAMVRKEDELTPSPPKGRNALRIAMSCDGKAVIRAENEPSPSKNRVAMFSVRRTKQSSLRRTSSAIFPATPRADMTEKDRVFGRSRDPRNWESFFDTDARSALSTPSSSQTAPHLSPGLFQSRSQRSLTRSASTRHSLAIHEDNARTPISQSMETDRNRANASSKLSKSMSKSHKPGFELDAGDSDKENWVPGTRSSQARRRPNPNATRSVLRDANRNRGLGLSTNGKRNRPLGSGVQGKAPDVDADVSAFMAGGNGGSQEDDLDCVQGLLSLSQGAWR